MSYGIGAADVINAPLRLQNTVDGDDFFSLGRAYFGASTLANGQKIIRMQPEFRIPVAPPGGTSSAARPITKASIQAFVKSRPGWSPVPGLRPFVRGDNPGTIGVDGKPEGYAIFTSRTQLMLPDMPRLDGKSPGVPSGGGGGGGVSEAGAGGGMGAALLIGGFALVTFLVVRRRK